MMKVLNYPLGHSGMKIGTVCSIGVIRIQYLMYSLIGGNS